MKDNLQYQISKEGETLTIQIGLERFHFMRYYRIIFLPIFLILLLFLTGLFIKIFAISVIFTIPFWFAIVLMIIGNINSFKETQIIKIDNKNVVIEKVRPIYPIKYQIPICEIQQIQLKQLEIGFGKRFNKENWLIWLKGFRNYVQLPTIITNTTNYYFFEYGDSKIEKEELTKMLEEIIFKK